MEKAVRWAIGSTAATLPCATVLLLPKRPNVPTAYTKWLQHPAVQTLMEFSPAAIQFQNPCNTPGCTQAMQQLTAPTTTMLLIAISNPTGADLFLSPPTLTLLKQELSSAAAASGWAPPSTHTTKTSRKWKCYTPRRVLTGGCLVYQGPHDRLLNPLLDHLRLTPTHPATPLRHATSLRHELAACRVLQVVQLCRLSHA